MKKLFTYENTSCPYHLIQEPRKTISATVFPNQTVIVKAPTEADTSNIEAFLQRKFRWILKQKRYFSQFKPNSPKQYVSGESFRYLGRSYKLLVRNTSGQPRVSLQYGTFQVLSPNPKKQALTEKLLNAWYTKKAEDIFQERLQHCFDLFDYADCPSLSIRQLKKRWGSYSRKTHRIILNRNLIQATKAQIDYVLIHELCHVLHTNHNHAFFVLLNKKLPGSAKTKEELELRSFSS